MGVYRNLMLSITDYFYTMTEAAELLNVNRLTINRWVKEGKLDAQRVGRVTFIEKEQADELKRQRQATFGTPA